MFCLCKSFCRAHAVCISVYTIHCLLTDTKPASNTNPFTNKAQYAKKSLLLKGTYIFHRPKLCIHTLFSLLSLKNMFCLNFHNV